MIYHTNFRWIGARTPFGNARGRSTIAQGQPPLVVPILRTPLPQFDHTNTVTHSGAHRLGEHRHAQAQTMGRACAKTR